MSTSVHVLTTDTWGLTFIQNPKRYCLFTCCIPRNKPLWQHLSQSWLEFDVNCSNSMFNRLFQINSSEWEHIYTHTRTHTHTHTHTHTQAHIQLGGWIFWGQYSDNILIISYNTQKNIHCQKVNIKFKQNIFFYIQEEKDI